MAYLTRFGEGMLPGPDTSYQQGDTVHAMIVSAQSTDVAHILCRSPREGVLA